MNLGGHTSTQSTSLCPWNFTAFNLIACETYLLLSIGLKGFESFQQSLWNLEAKVSSNYQLNQLRGTLKIKFREENRLYSSKRAETTKKEKVMGMNEILMLLGQLTL